MTHIDTTALLPSRAMAEAENEEDRGLLDDDDGGGANENAALFLVGTMWIIDNRGRRKVSEAKAKRSEHIHAFSADHSL